MWIFALDRLGRLIREYRKNAIELVRQIHPHFVVPGVGVHWKMREDFSRPYPGYGLGALDPYHGYVVNRLPAQEELAEEIAQMREIIDDNYLSLPIDQDLGLGMMLWMSHFVPDEAWAVRQSRKSLDMLNSMWIDPPGYFCRHPAMRTVKYAFTNYGISIGLQAVRGPAEEVEKLNAFFDFYRSEDEYDTEAITHVMACASWYPGKF